MIIYERDEMQAAATKKMTKWSTWTIPTTKLSKTLKIPQTK